MAEKAAAQRRSILTAFAQDFPEMFVEHVGTHLSVRDFTELGACCKWLAAMACMDLYWARRFSEREWKLSPIPIRSLPNTITARSIDSFVFSSNALVPKPTPSLYSSPS